MHVSWFFLLFDFLLQELPCWTRQLLHFGGGQSGFHFLSHFCGVHHHLSVEITGGNLPTLYKPKSPRSRSTLRALTLGPVVISPATCSRIFTISSGLVKMTWEPPACRQGRREKQISKSEPDWQCNKKKSRKASKLYHLTSPSSTGNESTALWPVHRDGPNLWLVCTWNVKCFSDQSFQGQPSYIQNGKTNKLIWTQKWSQMWQWGAPMRGKEMLGVS